MDKIYLYSDEEKIKFLDCTRLDGSNDLVSRINSNDINNVDNQIKSISDKLKAIGQNQILLADDVVFSGSVLRTITNKFRKNKVEVIGIRTSISTMNSYEYFNSIMPLGLKCGYLMDKDVIDQICERDFYFGIAQSGISVKNSTGEIYKAPYFKPFGDPIERASIPSNYEESFSIGCKERSIGLWLEIEKLSNKKILMSDLPERINGARDNQRVLSTLINPRTGEIVPIIAFGTSENVRTMINDMVGECIIANFDELKPKIPIEKIYEFFGITYIRGDTEEEVKVLKKGRK